jgi:hypothetical protein
MIFPQTISDLSNHSLTSIIFIHIPSLMPSSTIEQWQPINPSHSLQQSNNTLPHLHIAKQLCHCNSNLIPSVFTLIPTLGITLVTPIHIPYPDHQPPWIPSQSFAKSPSGLLLLHLQQPLLSQLHTNGF